MTWLTFEDNRNQTSPGSQSQMRSVKEHIVELEVETPEEEL